MPYHIEERDDEFCVIKNDDGANMGCHDTRAEADDQLAALYANEPTKAEAGAAFTLLITVEGLETADGRLFELGGLEPRSVLPVPLMVQNRAEHGGMMGDTTSWFAGAIEEVERDPRDDTRWIGRGHLMANEEGKKAEELIRGGLRGVSVDAAAKDVTLDIRAVDQDGFPVDVLYRFAKGTIMGATVTPHPAFEQCCVWFEDEDEPEIISLTVGGEVPMTEEPELVEQDLPLLVASGGPERPPRGWFDPPDLFGPTPLTVLDSGQIFGHIASWETCHIGKPEICVTAPISPSSYAYFHTGEVICADGERVSVGSLTLGTGHADMNASARQAVSHYDDTGTAAADIRCGEDEYGIWCAGAVRPHLDERDIRAVMAAAPSGDWRRINGYLELVGILCVNVPGFPIPRTNARVASGAEQALVAAPGPGAMSWPLRFSDATDGFMRQLRQMIREVVKAEMSTRNGKDDDKPRLPPEQARLRHVAAPPLNPDVRTDHERRVAELVAAGRARRTDN